MSPPPEMSDLDVSTVDNFIALAPPVSYGQKKAFAAIGAICLVIGGAAMAMRILTSRRSGEKTLARDCTFGVAMVSGPLVCNRSRLTIADSLRCVHLR
jgi:hypothetical protein